MFHAEPAPSTVTSPCEPPLDATFPPTLLTTPREEIVSVAVPLFPTFMKPELTTLDPVPVTVRLPIAPPSTPILVAGAVMLPPAEMLIDPLPKLARLIAG